MVGNILRQRYESLEKRADSLQEGDGRRNTRLLVKTLQLLVGALVTVGGSAFTVFALNDFGKALGAIHLSIGLIGIVTGFVILWSKMLPRRFLLGVNFATIVYSSFSEGVVQVQSLLPTGPSSDSLIGTIAAVIMSSAIIYLLLKKNR